MTSTMSSDLREMCDLLMVSTPGTNRSSKIAQAIASKLCSDQTEFDSIPYDFVRGGYKLPPHGDVIGIFRRNILELASEMFSDLVWHRVMSELPPWICPRLRMLMLFSSDIRSNPYEANLDSDGNILIAHFCTAEKMKSLFSSGFVVRRSFSYLLPSIYCSQTDLTPDGDVIASDAVHDLLVQRESVGQMYHHCIIFKVPCSDILYIDRYLNVSAQNRFLAQEAIRLDSEEMFSAKDVSRRGQLLVDLVLKSARSNDLRSLKQAAISFFGQYPFGSASLCLFDSLMDLLMCRNFGVSEAQSFVAAVDPKISASWLTRSFRADFTTLAAELDRRGICSDPFITDLLKHTGIRIAAMLGEGFSSAFELAYNDTIHQKLAEANLHMHWTDKRNSIEEPTELEAAFVKASKRLNDAVAAILPGYCLVPLIPNHRGEILYNPLHISEFHQIQLGRLEDNRGNGFRVVSHDCRHDFIGFRLET